MHSPFSRRRFVQTCALALGGAGLAPRRLFGVEPIRRAGEPRLLLSLAAYSFRDYLQDSNHPRTGNIDPARRIDLFQFVDFCAEHGCVGTELTNYYFPQNLDEAYLIQLRRHCFLRGVAVSGTAVGNTFTHPSGAKREQEIAGVKKWVDHAALLGAPHIRVFAGNAQPGQSPAEAKKLCIAALEECGDYAGRKGIFLGLENHGGIVAEPAEILDIVRTVRNPWIGINLDTGNFRTEDPYRDVADCAPYAVNVQIKAEIQRKGMKKEVADLKRMVLALRAVNYQGYIALEYEADEDPWKAVPGLLKTLQGLFA